MTQLLSLVLRAQRRFRVAVGNGIPHVRVRLDVLHPVVIHDAQVAMKKRFGHRMRHLRFDLDHLCLHFLLQGHRHGASLFGLGLGDLFVRISLGNLQFGPDVFAHIHIGDVD